MTAVFLAVFVVQLLIYGFHELTEANIFPYSEPLHWATEPYGPDGRYGQWLTYLLVILPMGWLVFAGIFGGETDAAAGSADGRALGLIKSQVTSHTSEITSHNYGLRRVACDLCLVT